MTGFGRGSVESDSWKATVMIRSLNGKGLEVSVRMPSFLMPVEPKIKDRIKKSLKRGTVHVLVEVDNKGTQPPVDLERFAQVTRMIRDTAEDVGLKPSDDVVFEYAWKASEKSSSEIEEDLEKVILGALEDALAELIDSRSREGKALEEDLRNRIERIDTILSEIVEKKGEIMESMKQKILERAGRLGIDEEHPMVVNEIMFLLEKMDVEEEITRLRTHVERFRKLLGEEGEVGKKLEFMAQELHREINTLGNKIPRLSPFVVDMKAEIDRIKQQAANVE